MTLDAGDPRFNFPVCFLRRLVEQHRAPQFRQFRLHHLRLLIRITLFVIAIAAVMGEGTRQLITSAHAQSQGANLSGVILDENGAVVSDAVVTVWNPATGVERQVTTSYDGLFMLRLLQPGQHRLTVQREGFGTVEVPHVLLNVNDELSLKVRLKVGSLSATVTIVADVAGLRDTAAPGIVVNRQLIESLPLNGRSLQSLFELSPGAVLTPSSFNEQGQFSVNGQRANANYLMVDGVSANIGVSSGGAPGQAAGGSLPALTALGTTSNLVSVDALQEVSIQTSTFAPEFGRSPGAQISMTTRSGTNELRGAIFQHFRSGALDAHDWFANSRGLSPPAYQQHNFGGILGGPVIKDQTFFFLSYEGLRMDQPQVAITDVPSASARRSAPAHLKPFFNAFPLPNGPDLGKGLAEFAANYTTPARADAASLRLDHSIKGRLALFARYNYAPSNSVQRGGVIVPGFSGQSLVNPNQAQSLNTLTRASLNTQTFTAGANFAVSPRVSNDWRINWSRVRGATTQELDDFGGAVPLARAQIFPPFISTQDAAFRFYLDGGTHSSLGIGKNADNLQRQLNLVNHLSISLGAHQLKFGVDYRRLTPRYDPPRYSQTAQYNGLTREPGLAPEPASPATHTSVQITADAGPRFPVFTNFSAYAQDTWQIKSRLALTYGLRWEINPPPSEASGRAPSSTPLWKPRYDKFAPRVGAVYQLFRRPGLETVLRGGFGIFYDLGSGQAGQAFGSVSPYVEVKHLSNITYPLTDEQAAPPSLGSAQNSGTTISFRPNLELPIIYQWNVAIEQSLGSQQRLRATYIAANGDRLHIEDVSIGLVNNQPAVVQRSIFDFGSSSYDALQIQFGRRFSRGLQALASYTWSSSFDRGSSDSAFQQRRDDDHLGEQAPSDFDVRHSFNAGLTYQVPASLADKFRLPMLRDWAVDALIRARTAPPLNIVFQRSLESDRFFFGALLQRPDLVPGVPLYINDPSVPGGRRINRAAFRIPSEFSFGTLGRNALRGFGFSQLDLAVRRQFNLTEQLKLLGRIEVFNVLNRPNFGAPVNNLNSEMFGQSTQMLSQSLGAGGVHGGLTPLYQVGGARSIQLSLKLNF